ncbi:Hypothetical predicted protein [Paramuricea clavata]|uniref:Uncharacterized protein n=1 Tax=Paramuricea clavata TaxID=317549 RepID=A0A7D9J6W2_PARCT|nr:Hypothetical predicted protein [Paramuricea clavata]
MAYGHPVSGKFTAVKAVMAVIGQDENKTGDCSHVGAMATLSHQSLPFWWDDVADTSVLEKVTVDALNKSKRKKEERTVVPPPQGRFQFCTIIHRQLQDIFSRIVVIPYKILQTKEEFLKKSLALQADMKKVMAQVIQGRFHWASRRRTVQ